MKSLHNVLMRIVAVFAASGLSVIGAGAIAGVDTITAVTVAGLTAVAAVVARGRICFFPNRPLGGAKTGYSR